MHFHGAARSVASINSGAGREDTSDWEVGAERDNTTADEGGSTMPTESGAARADNTDGDVNYGATRHSDISVSMPQSSPEAPMSATGHFQNAAPVHHLSRPLHLPALYSPILDEPDVRSSESDNALHPAPLLGSAYYEPVPSVSSLQMVFSDDTLPPGSPSSQHYSVQQRPTEYTSTHLGPRMQRDNDLAEQLALHRLIHVSDTPMPRPYMAEAALHLSRVQARQRSVSPPQQRTLPHGRLPPPPPPRPQPAEPTPSEFSRVVLGQPQPDSSAEPTQTPKPFVGVFSNMC
jgi:hypothetical protein